MSVSEASRQKTVTIWREATPFQVLDKNNIYFPFPTRSALPFRIHCWLHPSPGTSVSRQCYHSTFKCYFLVVLLTGNMKREKNLCENRPRDVPFPWNTYLMMVESGSDVSWSCVKNQSTSFNNQTLSFSFYCISTKNIWRLLNTATVFGIRNWAHIKNSGN